MFYIYKTNSKDDTTMHDTTMHDTTMHDTIDKYNIDHLKYLHILRLDLTELDLYNYRFHTDKSNSVKSNTDKSNTDKSNTDKSNTDKYINNINSLNQNYQNNVNKKLESIVFLSNDFTLDRPSGILTESFFKYLSNFKNFFKIYFVSKNLIKKPFSFYGIVVENKNDKQIKNFFLENKIDILIDMQGHMNNNYNHLLCERLCPIQLHFLGYPGTTGLSTIDYLIADNVIIPEESRQFYREKIAYMPNCYQCNSDTNLINKTITDYNNFKFCNFNFYYKLDKKIIFVWIEILKKVPNSFLYLLSGKYDSMILEYAKNNNIVNRIIFSPIIKHSLHISRLSKFDLGLDSYRINGHTTTSDLINAGVPIITYASDTYHNRVSKSILISLDLEELVCNSYNEYIDLSVKIATNPVYHKELICKIEKNRKKYLFNSKLYTNNFVNLLYNIWENHYGTEIEYISKLDNDTNDTNEIKKINDKNEILKKNNNYINKVIELQKKLNMLTNSKIIIKMTISYKKQIESYKKQIESYKKQIQLYKNPVDSNKPIDSNNTFIKEPLKKFIITKFGNNYIKNKIYEWIYTPHVIIDTKLEIFKDLILFTVDSHAQILRDIAEDTNECMAFTTNGCLFNSNPLSLINLTTSYSTNYNDGIWIKERLNVSSGKNKEIINIINKDYNLPLITILYSFTDLETLYKIIDYNFKQHYLNTEIIIFNDCKVESVLNKDTLYKKYKKEDLFNIQIVSNDIIDNSIDKHIKKYYNADEENGYYLLINSDNIDTVISNVNYLQILYDKYISKNNLNKKLTHLCI